MCTHGKEEGIMERCYSIEVHLISTACLSNDCDLCDPLNNYWFFSQNINIYRQYVFCYYYLLLFTAIVCVQMAWQYDTDTIDVLLQQDDGVQSFDWTINLRSFDI